VELRCCSWLSSKKHSPWYNRHDGQELKISYIIIMMWTVWKATLAKRLRDWVQRIIKGFSARIDTNLNWSELKPYNYRLYLSSKKATGICFGVKSNRVQGSGRAELQTAKVLSLRAEKPLIMRSTPSLRNIAKAGFQTVHIIINTLFFFNAQSTMMWTTALLWSTRRPGRIFFRGKPSAVDLTGRCGRYAYNYSLRCCEWLHG